MTEQLMCKTNTLAVDVYCGDNYGTMLWPLFEESAGKYFRCWNRCVKMCWSVPESTHTLFIDNLLGAGFTSLRINVISRYVNFFQGLLNHRSREISLIANIIGQDIGSVTGRNLNGIRLETSLNPWSVSSFEVKSTLKSQIKYDEKDDWKLFLLEMYLLQRQEKEENMKNTEDKKA